MWDKRPIGIFDSGVGGLSVLQEIKKILPHESFVFLADQGHNPYGARTKKELKDLSERITEFLLKYKIKALVVACNTATCYALDHLRSKFKIPIIGVVPAIKPATAISKKGRIAIMSTPATAKSQYLASLISQFAKDFKVLKLGCEGLEESIEYLRNGQITKLLDKYSEEVKEFQADVVVLGCTHFPFLKGDIKRRLGQNVKVIDSGNAIAKRLHFILKQRKAFSSGDSVDLYFTTLDPQKFSKVASKLLKYKVKGLAAQI